MTAKDIKDRLRTIKLETERLRAQLKRLEPKPKRPKVKVRRVVSAEERERARLYEAFREEHQTCWLCFRPGNYPPPGWDRPFMIERAHITKPGLSRRLEDIRLVCALCSRCHDLHTKGVLTTANMLWLKRANDKDNWDEKFLQEHSIRRLPEPEQPDRLMTKGYTG